MGKKEKIYSVPLEFCCKQVLLSFVKFHGVFLSFQGNEIIKE
jgi:hypothetical protein